ncbi:MAG: toll/interleukin-1 receptor domain-containing protein, partial [Planctomycetota bacterium]
MRLFVSFASEDREIAEQIALALRVSHEVFFDRDTLPAGGDFNTQIRDYIAKSDVLIFLISPESVRSGSYALSELKFARKRWSSPKGHVLPVMVRNTPIEDVPNYLKAVNILEPEGNIAAEVAAAVEEMGGLDFLNPVNAGAKSIIPLADSLNSFGDRDRQEAASITADLTSLLEELRRTHSTIVKMVSPLRRVPDDPKVFPVEFLNVYNDFRDVYDAY